MDTSTAQSKQVFLPARTVNPDLIPWIPLGTGTSFKPLRFFKDDRGFVELFRIEPGTVIPLHRHTGEIHAYQLEGSRRLCTGETMGPGDYVYEPAGNVDSWHVTGDVPCVIFVTVEGAVEFLGTDGLVERRTSCETLRKLYRDYCAANGISELDLVD